MIKMLKTIFGRKELSKNDIQGLRKFAEIEFRKDPQYGYEKLKKEFLDRNTVGGV